MTENMYYGHWYRPFTIKKAATFEKEYIVVNNKIHKLNFEMFCDDKYEIHMSKNNFIRFTDRNQYYKIRNKSMLLIVSKYPISDSNLCVKL